MKSSRPLSLLRGWRERLMGRTPDPQAFHLSGRAWGTFCVALDVRKWWSILQRLNKVSQLCESQILIWVYMIVGQLQLLKLPCLQLDLQAKLRIRELHPCETRPQPGIRHLPNLGSGHCRVTRDTAAAARNLANSFFHMTA